MARMVSSGRPSRRRHDCGGVLSVKLSTTIPVDRARTSRELGRGVHAGVSGGARGGRDQVGAQGQSDGHAGLTEFVRGMTREGCAECGQRRREGACTVGQGRVVMDHTRPNG